MTVWTAGHQAGVDKALLGLALYEALATDSGLQHTLLAEYGVNDMFGSLTALVSFLVGFNGEVVADQEPLGSAAARSVSIADVRERLLMLAQLGAGGSEN